MINFDEIKENIRECFMDYIAANGFEGYYKLGLKVGISETAVRDFLKQRTRTSIKTLTAITKFLDKQNKSHKQQLFKVKEFYNG